MTSEKESRYQAIFESETVGLVASNFSGAILDANDYFLKMLGYTRADLVNKELNWLKLTATSSLEQSLAAVTEMKSKKTSVTFEKAYLHKDGHMVPTLVAAMPVSDQSDEIIAVVIDASQRKQIEKKLSEPMDYAKDLLEARVAQRTQELQRSEAFLEAVFENNPNMIFVKDAKDLRFLRFNRAGEQLLGVPRSQLIGKNDYDFFPKEQADAFTSKDRDVLHDYRVVDIAEEVIQTVAGIRFLHTKKIPVFNKEGNPEYLLGVSEDITEKKEAEKQKLALLEERIAREGAEARAKQMSFLSDLSLLLTESFDQEKILKSFSAKVVSFLSDICITHITDTEDLKDEMVLTEIASREPKDLSALQAWQAQQAPHNGSLLDTRQAPFPIYEIMQIPIQIRGQNPIGFVSFLMKTQDRAFNEMDRSLAEEITRRLAISLENARLYFSAQEASRAKSAFLANVSHELRTPLGAMLGFAEILSEDPSLSREQSESIQTVLRNGQQLLYIVNEILDISKAESERIQIENIAFSLPSLLDDVIHLLKGRADQKGIPLTIDKKNLPSFIRSDPTRIRQILNNVIGNAIKFTDQGRVHVEVSTQKSHGHDRLEFQVIDTGIGISEEDRAHLFQPFTQVDNSTTRRFGGTGLGLFLARKLARLLGGDVSLQSSLSGQGSRFLVSISYNEASAPLFFTPERADSQKSLPEVRTSLERNLTVLIVDDAVDNRELFRRYLLRLGVSPNQIDMAQNGVEALYKTEQKNYDLILMDIQMPEMDGFQALAELKRRNFGGFIAALTAHAMKGDEEKCLKAGFNSYLQKPLNREALGRVLSLAEKVY